MSPSEPRIGLLFTPRRVSIDAGPIEAAYEGLNDVSLCIFRKHSKKTFGNQSQARTLASRRSSSSEAKIKLRYKRRAVWIASNKQSNLKNHPTIVTNYCAYHSLESAKSTRISAVQRAQRAAIFLKAHGIV